MHIWVCRCGGALAQQLQAAVVVEDVSLQGAHGEAELEAVLRPAARPLRMLDTIGMDMTNNALTEKLPFITRAGFRGNVPNSFFTFSIPIPHWPSSQCNSGLGSTSSSMI
jgi:hypothetical protein